MIFCHLLTFFKIRIFKKFFQENYQRVPNSLDPDQDWHSVIPDLGSRPYAKAISRQQKALLARKELRHFQQLISNIMMGSSDDTLPGLIWVFVIVICHFPLCCLFFFVFFMERSGSVVECLTRDREAPGWSLTGFTALWSLSKTHIS